MPDLQDDHLHQGLRRRLVAELEKKGIRQKAVLEAIGRVPRHLFIDDTAFLRMAYSDIPFPIGFGQTISQPYTVAIQTTLLETRKGDRILEIGTGCGYQTAVLCELGVKVVSVERQRALFVRSSQRLPQLGYRARLIYGDGFKGAPMQAPFDKILVTCGAPDVPQALLDQLKVGGRLVIPVGAGDVQIMWSIDREGVDRWKRNEHGHFRFVPMLENKVKE